MNVLDKAFYEFLQADDGAGSLAESLEGGWHLDDAPQDTVRPYGIFVEASHDPVYTFGNTIAFRGLVYAVRTFAINGDIEDGPHLVGRLADRIESIFVNAALVVDGQTVASCRPLRAISPVKERDESDNKWIYSRGWLIEVWLT